MTWNKAAFTAARLARVRLVPYVVYYDPSAYDSEPSTSYHVAAAADGDAYCFFGGSDPVLYCDPDGWTQPKERGQWMAGLARTNTQFDLENPA